MGRGLRGVLIVVAIIAVVGIGVLAWNEWDKTRYSPVQGEIVSITEACEVNRRRRSNGTNSRVRVALLEEPCSAVRGRYGSGHYFDDMRSINYRYVSPVDGRTYPGTFHWRPSAARDRAPGQPIEVLAHKTEPGRSRHP